jgi:hypothetical protein
MTESLKELPDQVQGIASINRRGNIIDDGWYRHITYADSQHAHLLAIMILADICYWYTPTITKDEKTDVGDYKKKFAADKLQKTYKALSEKFGVSKRMAQTACYRLKELGLITIEIRDIDDRQGLTFLEPISENIKKISCMCLEFQNTPLTFKSDPPSLLKVTPPTFKSDHTYTTSETTLQIYEEEEEKTKIIQKETGSETLPKQYIKMALKVGANKSDLAAALKKMDYEPDIKNPIAWLQTALEYEVMNRELASRPKTKKDPSTKPHAVKQPKTDPSKYDNFYL